MEKEKSLSDEIMKHEHYGNERVLLVKDVKETVFKIFERIRLSPNRDDKIVPMEKPRLKLMFLDGGGIGKEEVKNIIKEEVGEELSQ